MEGSLLDTIPDWIELKILRLLEFGALLNARATCQRWNELISPYLAEHAILNIRMDKSYHSRQFRHGKWNAQLIPLYQEIRILPKCENAFYSGNLKGEKATCFQHFTEVKRFTLFENGSLLHFIHRYMKYFSNVKHVQIKELPFNEKAYYQDGKYTSVSHVFLRAMSHLGSFTRAMDNISKVETVRIRLYDRLASILYIQLFGFRMNSLTYIELDFTKLYDIPLNRGQISEINNAICYLLERCYITLRQLRMKWALRVDTDLDYIRSEEDIEPFFEFLLCLRNPIWMKLRLHQLALTFPTINLGFTLCETTLFPFLRELEPTLKRVSLSRVLPNSGMDTFVIRFPPPAINKFEFTFYFNDNDIQPQPVSMIRGVEVLVGQSSSEINRLFALSRGRRESALKHCIYFKLVNKHDNVGFMKPDLARITDHFQNIRFLEILDTSVHGKTYAVVSSNDFNLILRRLPKLISLKLSNASNLTDAGLTRIPKPRIRYMMRVGVFHFKNGVAPSVSRANELRFLDLRDLSPNVSDFSVYFAFQHIKKLEKIAFHGNHGITSWGKQLLKLKHKRNPNFEVVFRTNEEDHVVFGNYTLPCVDFP